MVIIVDSSVFMNIHSLRNFLGHSIQILISESCVKEIRSSLSRTIWATIESQVEVLKPSKTGILKANAAAQQLGEHRLSDADISAIALAIDHQMNDPLLISDDFSIQNVARLLKIKTQSSKFKKKARLRKYFYICKACGYNNGRNMNECDVCGYGEFKREF
ncbi:MAG: hypothetical protein D6732_10210 [Methanobacteriota archaeon]|nr:MAG: hypothetical protein D6732_10210 [Euryarchaeota archaeon]